MQDTWDYGYDPAEKTIDGKTIKAELTDKEIKKPVVRNKHDYVHCSICGKNVSGMGRINYCPNCGHAIDWEDQEQRDFVRQFTLNISIGDKVICTESGVVGTVLKFYRPTGCEEQTMVKTEDGREYHAPSSTWKKYTDGLNSASMIIDECYHLSEIPGGNICESKPVNVTIKGNGMIVGKFDIDQLIKNINDRLRTNTNR